VRKKEEQRNEQAFADQGKSEGCGACDDAASGASKPCEAFIASLAAHRSSPRDNLLSFRTFKNPETITVFGVFFMP